MNGIYRVNFSRRGFAKVINKDALSSFTPSPRALLTLGNFIGQLNLPAQTPKTFISIPEFRGIDYVGYIIEKERLDPTRGAWERLSEYHILGARSNSYKDSRVAYGQTYRYRIRSVVKFTTFNDTDALDNTQKTISLLTNIQKALSTAVTANAAAIKYINTHQGLSSKSSSQQQIEIGNAVGISNNNFFTFNVLDPASNSRLASLQTTVNSWLAKISSSKPLSYNDLIGYTNQLIASGVIVPKAIKTYYSEYIASYPSRNWHYVTIGKKTLPPPPSSIKIIPSTPNKTITIYWLAPDDAQRDLAYFTLYRREKVGQPWQLLKDNLNLADASYIDTDVMPNKLYIYAMTSTDLHGYKSFLSTQIQASLNASYGSEKKEKLLTWISGEGARLDESDTIFKRFYDPFEQLIATKNIKVTVSDTFSNDNATIVLRVKSLDTHETHDLTLNLRNISR